MSSSKLQNEKLDRIELFQPGLFRTDFFSKQSVRFIKAIFQFLKQKKGLRRIVGGTEGMTSQFDQVPPLF